MGELKVQPNLIQEFSDYEIKAFVGEKSEYYLGKWRHSEQPQNKSGWNWAAFFAGIFWLGYRKMYSIVFYIVGTFIVIDIIQSLANIDLNKGVATAVSLVLGISGNAFYFRFMQKRIIQIKSNSNLSDNDLEMKIQKAGGTSWGGVGIAALILIGYMIISICIDFII